MSRSRFCRQKVLKLAAETISFSDCLPHFENINSSNEMPKPFSSSMTRKRSCERLILASTAIKW